MSRQQRKMSARHMNTIHDYGMVGAGNLTDNDLENYLDEQFAFIMSLDSVEGTPRNDAFDSIFIDTITHSPTDGTEPGVLCRECKGFLNESSFIDLKESDKDVIHEEEGWTPSVVGQRKFECPNCRDDWTRYPPFHFHFPKNFINKLAAEKRYALGIGSRPRGFGKYVGNGRMALTGHPHRVQHNYNSIYGADSVETKFYYM